MKTKKADFPVDQTLTPETAEAKGYEWVNDIAYDETKEIEVGLYEDFKSLLADGFKIGQAKEPFNAWDKGLYRPLKSEEW